MSDQQTKSYEYLRPEFEAGHVPCDEPPGIEEREYQKWLADGGAVKSKPLAAKTQTPANDRQVGGDHYRLQGAAFQHWDMVAHFDLDYFQGQITRYLFRWRDKNGVEDLKKARHYLDKYIELAESAEGVPEHPAEQALAAAGQPAAAPPAQAAKVPENALDLERYKESLRRLMEVRQGARTKAGKDAKHDATNDGGDGQ